MGRGLVLYFAGSEEDSPLGGSFVEPQISRQQQIAHSPKEQASGTEPLTGMGSDDEGVKLLVAIVADGHGNDPVGGEHKAQNAQHRQAACHIGGDGFLCLQHSDRYKIRAPFR